MRAEYSRQFSFGIDCYHGSQDVALLAPVMACRHAEHAGEATLWLSIADEQHKVEQHKVNPWTKIRLLHREKFRWKSTRVCPGKLSARRVLVKPVLRYNSLLGLYVRRDLKPPPLTHMMCARMPSYVRTCLTIVSLYAPSKEAVNYSLHNRRLN